MQTNNQMHHRQMPFSDASRSRSLASRKCKCNRLGAPHPDDIVMTAHPDKGHFHLKHPSGKSHEYLELPAATRSLPASFTCSNLAAILDQGDIGSCVVNSADFIVATQSGNKTHLCRLLHYALCRI